MSDEVEQASQRQKQFIYDLGVENIPQTLDRVTASRWIEELSRYREMVERKEDVGGNKFRMDLFTDPPGGGAPAPAPEPKAKERPKVATTTARTIPPGETSRALAAEAEETPGLVPASQMATALLITPEVDIHKAEVVWKAFREFREFILKDPACADDIEGSREMNRTGATRLAIPFGLSIEERSIDEKWFDDGDCRFIVRIRVSKGQRFVDGIGSSRLSEIPEKTKKGGAVPLAQREHFAMTRAWTRGAKRALADILGGSEAE